MLVSDLPRLGLKGLVDESEDIVLCGENYLVVFFL